MSLRAFFCEAIPTFVYVGDCFVAKSAPRNDTIGELIHLQALRNPDSFANKQTVEDEAGRVRRTSWLGSWSGGVRIVITDWASPA